MRALLGALILALALAAAYLVFELMTAAQVNSFSLSAENLQSATTVSAIGWRISLLQTVISSLITCVIGLLLYQQVTHQQAARERIKFMHDIQDQLLTLLNAQLVKKEGEEKLYRYRNALGSNEWRTDFTNDTLQQLHLFVDGDNWVSIDHDGVRVSSQLLMETTVQFSRIERTLRAKVIKPKDLITIWRYLMPFAINNRLDFFELYLGKDHASMEYVLKKLWKEMRKKQYPIADHIARGWSDRLLPLPRSSNPSQRSRKRRSEPA